MLGGAMKDFLTIFSKYNEVIKSDLRFFLILVGLWLGVLGTSSAMAQGLPVSDIVIESGAKRHIFKVELADRPDTMTRGLMFRRSLPADGGMLFDYRAEQPVSMWMRNTYIPLDMLFIRADGRIAHIHERAIPHDETPISPAMPVRAVLEVNGGTVARLGIRAGDKVIHGIFR